jgi:hypothetical protein
LLLRFLPSSTTSTDDNTNEEKRDDSMGHSMQTIMNAIDHLFVSLLSDNRKSSIRPAFVERLLDFYWQVIKNIIFFN